MAEELTNKSPKDNEESLHYSIVKLRGLPWSSTPDDIMKFFSDCEITGGTKGIHIVMSRDNRPTGEAYVEFASSEDVAKALLRDRNHMGNRYIEVFRTRQSEFEWALRRQTGGRQFKQDACVKLRGLPFDCTKDEIASFFSGLEIIPNGVTLVTDVAGRSNGEAYVQFVSNENADLALKKHREKIGHRYIEIFRSSIVDVRRFCDTRYIDQLGSPAAILTLPAEAPISPQQRLGPYERSVYRVSRFPSINRGPRVYKDYAEYDNWNLHNGIPNPVDRTGILSGGHMASELGHVVGGLGSRGMATELIEMERVAGSGRLSPQVMVDRMPTPSIQRVIHDRVISPMTTMTPMTTMAAVNNINGNGMGWMNAIAGNNGGYGDNMIHYVHMRGLPFKAKTSDIINFFKPIIPINVTIKYEPNGRSTGEADVEFRNQYEAIQAMQRDKGHMQHRYIELFLNTNISRKPREVAINVVPEHYKSMPFF